MDESSILQKKITTVPRLHRYCIALPRDRITEAAAVSRLYCDVMLRVWEVDYFISDSIATALLNPCQRAAKKWPCVSDIFGLVDST